MYIPVIVARGAGIALKIPTIEKVLSKLLPVISIVKKSQVGPKMRRPAKKIVRPKFSNSLDFNLNEFRNIIKPKVQPKIVKPVALMPFSHPRYDNMPIIHL